jgi:cobalt-zinc-cadmium efflux system protein
MAHDDIHHHDHSEHGDRTLIWALLLTLGFAGIEALTGLWSGSLALLGDAGHMVSDSVALGFAAVAAWIARRPPTARHSYGLGRAEVVAALVNGMLMLAIVAGIVYEAAQRLLNPQPVVGFAVLLVAAIGLGVNIVVALVLHRGEGTLNTRAALLHVMGDLLGSMAALASGAVILVTGWTLIDPLLSVFICLLIVVSSTRLIREAMLVIMEAVPRNIDLQDVGAAIAATDARIRSVHDLHIWTLSSGMIALSAHLMMADLRDWDQLMANIRSMLHDRFGIAHVTLQPETGTYVLRPMHPAEHNH